MFNDRYDWMVQDLEEQLDQGIITVDEFHRELRHLDDEIEEYAAEKANELYHLLRDY